MVKPALPTINCLGKKMTFNPLLVVQNNFVSSLTGPMAIEWRKRGLPIIDISYDGETLPETSQEPVFVFGSVGLVKGALKHPTLSKWTFWEKHALGPEVWVESFGDRYLNRDGRCCYFHHAMAYYLQHFRNDDDKVHIRPMLNDKLFNGDVYDINEFVKLDIPDDTMIFMSSIKKITAEYRVWIIGGKVAAISQYRKFGKRNYMASPAELEEAETWAEIYAGRFTALPHYVMDLAVVKGGNFKVIELNSINSSGWYAADPGKVIDAYLEYYKPKS